MAFAIPLAMQAGSFILSNGMALLSAGAGIAGAVSMHNAGVDAQSQANQQAAQLDQQAKQERAISHYEMARQRAAQKTRASENQLGMSSGGLAGDDASSVNLVSEMAGKETLEQLLTKAIGEQRARNLENQGVQARIEGKQARKSATLSAFTHLLGAGASWADRYGPSRTQGAGALTKTKTRTAMAFPTSTMVKTG